jgi:hypothetical protein
MYFVLKRLVAPANYEMIGPILAAGSLFSCLSKGLLYISFQSEIKTAAKAKLGIVPKVKPIVVVSVIQNNLVK